MALKWCAMHGLLPEADAAAWVEDQARARAAGLKSPVKARSRASTGGGAARSGARKPAAGKRAAPAGKAVPSAKTKRAASWESDASDSDSDAPLAARAGKKAAPAVKRPASGARPASGTPKARPAARDAAFTDGGLGEGSSDDDDVPLAARVAAA